MPYKFTKDKIKMPREKDKRIKITEEMKNEIKYLYIHRKLSIHAIAREFPQINRRSIQFILFPERLTIVKEQFKQRRKDGRYYPGKDKWKLIMRKHRKHKQEVLKELKLI